MADRKSVLADDFRTTPYWWEAAPPESAPHPLPSRDVDVAIVGSGYTGLCCAIELAENGLDVVVLDAGDLGSGASTRSGAMVTGGQKLVVSGAIKGIPPDRQARMLEDARESLALMEERIARYQLDADYVRYGRVILAAVPHHWERLERWAKLLGTVGKSSVHLVPKERLHEEVGDARYHGGLLIDDYGGLHPGKYHRALRNTARAKGARLLSQAAVTAIVREPAGFLLRTARGEVKARHVVMGTNGYSGPVNPYLQKRVVPVEACVIATETLPPGMAERMIPRKRMLSDTRKNLYWMRLTPDGTRLILGAKPSPFHVSPQVAAAKLHRKACNVWPELRPVKVAFCWSGNVGMSQDGVPHMGVHEGIHFAVGCNGSGVAMMSYLGLQMARKLLGKQNRPCAFDGDQFPAPPLYNGTPWFIPLVASWYDLQDIADRVRARSAAH